MDVLTTEELAEQLRLKPQTLRSWRVNGSGPAWFTVSPGGPVRYRRSDVERWMEDRVAGPRAATQDPAGQSLTATSPCDE